MSDPSNALNIDHYSRILLSATNSIFMKCNLFYNLERAESNLTDAQKKVNDINNARGSYNYVISVPYTHKFKVACGGWLKTKWVWKTETRYRNEIRFDQERFDRDLAELNLIKN